MRKIMTTLFILTSLFILVSCGSSKTYDMIVTDYFTYDIVREITGDTLSIKTLQPNHMDYHTYEPTSQDLIDLKRTNLFIYTSINHSPWLGDTNQLNKLLNNGLYISFEALLDLDDVIHEGHDHAHDDHHDHDHGYDFISNPFYMIKIIDHLTHYLAETFTDYKADYLMNGHAYIEQLQHVAETFLEERQMIDSINLYFIGHNALSGFKEAFDIDITALDENISPNSDTTSSDVTNFIKALNDNQIKYLFVEENHHTQTIDFIKSKVNGLTVLELHTFHTISRNDYEQDIGYLDLIKRNIKHVRKVIKDEAGL